MHLASHLRVTCESYSPPSAAWWLGASRLAICSALRAHAGSVARNFGRLLISEGDRRGPNMAGFGQFPYSVTNPGSEDCGSGTKTSTSQFCALTFTERCLFQLDIYLFTPMTFDLWPMTYNLWPITPLNSTATFLDVYDDYA